MRRIKEPWQKLTSGLYVPPYLQFAPGYPCCCDEEVCPCPVDTCAEGCLPPFLEMTINGITEQAPEDCGSCSGLNGTFILDRIETSPEGDFSYIPPCTWLYIFPSPICSVISINARLEDLGPTEFRMLVFMFRGEADPVVTWISFPLWEQGVEVCADWEDEPISFMGFESFDFSCDAHEGEGASQATCSVTAL